jgi:hypothetical protein
LLGGDSYESAARIRQVSHASEDSIVPGVIGDEHDGQRCGGVDPRGNLVQ